MAQDLDTICMNSAFFVGNKKLLQNQRHRVEDVRLIHYTSLRAEDLASKAALIILLTGCQANAFQNKHVSKKWLEHLEPLR